MKKKTWVYLSAATLILLGGALFFLLRAPAGSGTYDNLIVNGTFEALDEHGLPTGWYTDAYIDQNYTDYGITSGVTGNAARIQNHYANDARFAQAVAVSPNTTYRLHGYIKSSAQGGLGANLSIEGIYVFSEMVYDTDGEWQEVVLYGRTGEKQRSVTVYARLGGYSGEATGEAAFDDITLCRVDSVPAGEVEKLWYTLPPAVIAEENSTATGAWQLALGCVLYFGLFVLLLPWLRPRKTELKVHQKVALKEAYALAGLLLAALAARLAIAAAVPGYDVDIGCFRGWSAQMAAVGPTNFYQSMGFCDYPPGYLWILWLVGWIGKLAGGVSEWLVKLPPILADMALCVLIYTEGKKRLSGREALALSALYAFNPLVFVTGAAWGQTDSIMTLLLFLTVVSVLRGQWKAALPIYVAAVLVKPQALMFGPLGLGAMIVHLVKAWKTPEQRKAAFRDAGLGLGLSVATGLVIVLPFSIHQSWDWLFTLYGGTMSQYGYATVNACNLYFLLGKNWSGTAGGLSGDWLVPLIAYLLMTLPLVAVALVRSTQEKASLLQGESRLRLYGFGGLALALGVALLALGGMGQLTYATLGTCMIVYSVALVVLLYVLGNDPKNLPLLGATLLLMLFSTGSMMHERYLFPAVALLVLAYFMKKDKRILWLAVGVSLMGFLNVGCVLDRNIRISGVQGHLNAPACGIKSDMAFLEYLAAAGNCLLCGLAVVLSTLLCRRDEKILSFAPQTEKAAYVLSSRPAPLPANEPLRKMTGRDWAVMLGVTALYAVLALTNLGSTKAPQTAWVSSGADEQITVDLGEEKTFQMLYYMGIHWQDNDFTVEVSRDGLTWERSYIGSVKSGDTFDCFKWKYLPEYKGGSSPAQLTGRYVRLTAHQVSLTLFETLFRDAETGETLPIASIQDSLPGVDCAALTDEQDTLTGEPGWYNSTYFDEIYHARTAYEHLHGLRPYETTHPPLGKVLMSFAIAIFGMTPFGWRFAGALAGILMLPGMYLLGKLLIKKNWGGLGAMLLMALDLMHFTQTRIATIDSFVVLFIIWMLYFMLRWFFLDFFGTDFWKSLVLLCLSGLFMGLAVASKWTGCYGGVGLALIFFFGLWRRYREIRAAKAIPEKKRTDHDRAAASGMQFLVITVICCFSFFIGIPLLIYYASYIPYFAFSGGVTVKKVIEAAVGNYFTTGVMGGMLGYHATPGLGMDHSFYSPWYEWPIIGKPMWYSSSAFEPAGMQSTIMAMGNPAVWWGGLIGLLGVIGLWAKRHVRQDRTLALHPEKDDPRFALLLIFFAAQYLPWVLVPRGTYIYHYFPCVSIIILCTLLCLDNLAERYEKAARILLCVLLAAAAALFIAFFPYASGVMVSQGWLDAMKWFPRWLWY